MASPTICPTCDGTGGCQRCRGSGKVRCLLCGGTGTHASICDACGGSGFVLVFGESPVPAARPCQNCGGSGYPGRSCPMCNGSGSTTCMRCVGLGECLECGGAGSIDEPGAEA